MSSVRFQLLNSARKLAVAGFAGAVACGGAAEELAATEDAILESYAPQVGMCQWPSVVSISNVRTDGWVSYCTGSVLKHGLQKVVVTASHCLTKARRFTFRWGENGNQPVSTVTLEEDDIAALCTKHPQGHDTVGGLFGDTEGYTGVDLAYCRLPVNDFGPGGLPDIPALTLGTCQEAYFEHQIATGTSMRLIGTGGHVPVPEHETDFGVKRQVSVEFEGYVIYEGAPHLKLYQPDRCADERIVRGGDSGSPIFAQMADGSWRQVAVVVAASHEPSNDCANGEAKFLYATPLSRHLPWIEHSSGVDLTRCFDFDPQDFRHEWSWEPVTLDGQCFSQALSTTPGQTGSKDWSNLACTEFSTNVSPHASGQCAGWQPCSGPGVWPSCSTISVAAGGADGSGGDDGSTGGATGFAATADTSGGDTAESGRVSTELQTVDSRSVRVVGTRQELEANFESIAPSPPGDILINTGRLAPVIRVKRRRSRR